MKYQDLFSLKNKKMKILDCRLLQVWLGALRVDDTNSPNVIYPMFSPVRASVFCNSAGGSLWLNKTCGACW